MDKTIELVTLEKLVSNYTGCILYTPLQNEPDYNDSLFPLEIPPNKITLPINKNTNPFEWADICRKYFKDINPYILIPGNKFDIYGTRHGKGGGWYDRFLSQIPEEWLRIGVTDSPKLFSEALIKHHWDKPMDYLFSFNQATSSWRSYQTFARHQ